jgi:HK97 family phage prohead protease
MMFVVDGNPNFARIEAADFEDAESKVAAAGGGTVVGELVHEQEAKTLHRVSALEAKFLTGDDDARTFEGYGAVFGNVDGGGDVIAPGAFSSSLAQHKAAGTMPMMLWQHNLSGMPIGKWQSMTEDATGLKVKGKLLTTSFASDVHIALKEGALNGMSIGYRVIAADPRNKPKGAARLLTKLDLVEVSIVGLPMNDRARVTGVKAADEIITIRDLERSLRDAGYSRSDAERVCARFQAKADQGDPDASEAATAAIRRLTSSMKGLIP